MTRPFLSFLAFGIFREAATDRIVRVSSGGSRGDYLDLMYLVVVCSPPLYPQRLETNPAPAERCIVMR